MEKDFSILKKEEQEEQVEMRVRHMKLNIYMPWFRTKYVSFLKRLRAENKLLKQRIDNLEKVNETAEEKVWVVVENNEIFYVY